MQLYFSISCSACCVSASTVNVSLGSTVFYSSKVRMQCASQTYEDATSTCQPCIAGTGCETDGATVSALVVMPGYWRSGTESEAVYECSLAHACQGSTIGNATNSTNLCAAGYVGPICATCEREYYFSWSTETCELCNDGEAARGSTAIHAARRRDQNTHRARRSSLCNAHPGSY